MGAIAQTTGYSPALWKSRFRGFNLAVSRWLTDADLPLIRQHLPELLELLIEAHPHLDDFTPRKRLDELWRGVQDPQTIADFEAWFTRTRHTTVETYANQTIPAGDYAAEQCLRLMVGLLAVSLDLGRSPTDLRRDYAQHAQVLVHAALALCPDEPSGPVARDAFARVSELAVGRALDLAAPKPEPIPGVT